MLEKFDAFQIAKKYYWSCKTLKVAKYLQDQLLRASSSIALNTAEGTPQTQSTNFPFKSAYPFVITRFTRKIGLHGHGLEDRRNE